MVLIVDHRSRLPEGILDCLQFRHVKQIKSELIKLIVILSSLVRPSTDTVKIN